MGRARNKDELMDKSKEAYDKLKKMMENLTDEELETDFDFSKDEKKKESHWKRDKNLRDVLVHLYEWHRLLIEWVDSNENGIEKPFLPEPYNWRTYPDMNIEIWKKHQDTFLEESIRLLDVSHKEVTKLLDNYTNEDLFNKGVYRWTGGTSLGSYFISSTSSHYEWAMKKLRAHKKNCKNKI